MVKKAIFQSLIHAADLNHVPQPNRREMGIQRGALTQTGAAIASRKVGEWFSVRT